MAFDRVTYMKEYNALHREQKRISARKYYSENKEKCRERSRKYRASHKEQISEYNRKYSSEHRDEIRERARPVLKKYREEHIAEHNESSKRQREIHKQEYHARSIVNHAICKGRLKRKPCEVCGNEKVQAHHDDYSLPLKVRWLCVRCHNDWHMHNEPKRCEQKG